MERKIVAVAILLVSIVCTAFPKSTQAQTPNVTIVLYANEWGFSFSVPTGSLSGGPALNFALDDVVNVTLVNMGTTQHTWEVIGHWSDNQTILFNSAILPVNPGESGNVTFTVTQTGTFSYLCYLSGHAGLGMVGPVNVVVPEFPTAAMFALFMIATLALALTKTKIRRQHA